jgi:hypothetical protein
MDPLLAVGRTRPRGILKIFPGEFLAGRREQFVLGTSIR